MKFHVNADCIGCGLCVSTCPEVFTMTDGGTAAAARRSQRNRRERTARLPANRSAPARSSGTASHSSQSPTQQLKAAPMENQNRARISPSLFRKRRSRLGLRLKIHDYTF